MKESKFNKLVEDLSYFVAEKHRASFHRIFFEDIQNAFPEIKKKHLRRAMKEVYDL